MKPLLTPMESMIARLKATGIYRLAPTDLVYSELSAYQSALDVLFEDVQDFEREKFLSTAESWGLQEAEWQFGLDGTGLTVDERRKRVMAYARSLVLNGGSGADAFSALLESMGCTGTAVRDGTRWTVYLETVPPSGRAEEILILKLKQAAPVNTEVQIITQAVTWEELDAQGETWDNWDAKKLTWDAFDRGEGIKSTMIKERGSV